MKSALLIATVAASLYAHASYAQSSTSSPTTTARSAVAGIPNAARDDAGLEEVVVTAQRREQNVQDVPISITAISGDMLARSSIRDPRELTLLTPSLAFQASTAASTTSLFIRGVGISDTSANTTGAVGVYVDDVFIGANAGKLFSIFDIESVEVLKGPQGTLYGRNTTAGAVRFSSRKPTDELSVDASALYGRFDEVQFEAGIGGPLVPDMLNVRVAGLYNKRDGWMLNRVTGNKLNDIDVWAARGIFDVMPDDDRLIRLIVHGGRSRGGARQFQHRGQGVDLFGNPSFLNGVPADLLGYADTDNDLNAGDFDQEGGERVEVFGASLTAELRLDDVKLTSISAYEKVDRRTVEDTDASPNNIITATYIDRPRQVSQEIRLASPDSGQITWVVGGYYYDEELKTNSSLDILRVLRDPSQPLGGFDPVSQIGNGIYPYTQTTKSLAAFGQMDFKLTDQLTATGGLRYSRDKIKMDYLRGFLEPAPVGLFELFRFSDQETYEDLSWRLALSYKATEDLLLYASYSKGYNSGGFPGGYAETPAQLQAFDAENLYAYEVGLKSDLFDRWLRFNAAAFYYDYRDLQVFAYDTTGVITVLRKLNAGDAQLYGLEVELAAEVAARLTLSAGATFLHSEYKDFVGIPTNNPEGNQMINAPKLAATGAITYTQPVGSVGEIQARVDGQYSSKTYLTTENSQKGAVPGRGILNGSLAWISDDDRYEIALYAKNITGRRYSTFFAPILTFDELNYNDPRTYGIRTRFRLR